MIYKEPKSWLEEELEREKRERKDPEYIYYNYTIEGCLKRLKHAWCTFISDGLISYNEYRKVIGVLPADFREKDTLYFERET